MHIKVGLSCFNFFQAIPDRGHERIVSIFRSVCSSACSPGLSTHLRGNKCVTFVVSALSHSRRQWWCTQQGALTLFVFYVFVIYSCTTRQLHDAIVCVLTHVCSSVCSPGLGPPPRGNKSGSDCVSIYAYNSFIRPQCGIAWMPYASCAGFYFRRGDICVRVDSESSPGQHMLRLHPHRGMA